MCSVQMWMAPFMGPSPVGDGTQGGWRTQSPAVHHGFLQSWRAGDLDQRVLQLVTEAVARGAARGHRVQVLLTGKVVTLARDKG